MPEPTHAPWCDSLFNAGPCRCRPSSAGIVVVPRNRPPPGKHHNRGCWVVEQHGREMFETPHRNEANAYADELEHTDG